LLDFKLSAKRVFYRGGFRPLEVGIRKGKITAVGRNLARAQRELDLGENLLLPGAIDSHVHLREPGETYKEDFSSGTKAAARGGVTSVLDMPNNKEPINSPERFVKKKKIGLKKALVNFGLYAALPQSPGELSALKEAGAIAFKHFTYERRLDLPLWVEAIDKLGASLVVHAEDPDFVQPLGEVSGSLPLAHEEARPAQAELKAAKRILAHPPDRLHLAHLTLAETIELASGRATVEVTPHHLLLAAEDLDPDNFSGVVNPPIRKREVTEKLQLAFNGGKVDTLGSDHAPHGRGEKLTDDPDEGRSGIPGLETLLPLTLSYARRSEASLRKTVEALTERPAAIFNLEKRGRIAEGYWADLTVVDPNEEREIRGERFSSNCKVTPFEGRRASFWPVLTMVNGEIVFEEGRLMGKGGTFLHG